MSHLSSETLTSLHSPFNSIILRDSSIREQSTAPSLEDNLSLNVGINANRYTNTYTNAPPHINPASIQMSSRDSTTSVFRDPSVSSSFTDSNRFLINGLDQRIIKQSSEDCRRLLQQVRLSNTIDCASPIPKYVQRLLQSLIQGFNKPLFSMMQHDRLFHTKCHKEY